ncbi:hypothetical protein KRX51_06840 [Corynebacterium sp. TAE3-ERU12]|uniref:lipopolysaccharide biosynthesis protein n=1 Tax=Corynebacterium sp. TAE3-ERU12 TaxID=2849491 RepID=UPI001C469548|nr:hypothetical protein [Corynebacterium sp. TAE3-ERU12]MBV7295633.1 hypothetical protein [Corynebacterium sp. TAE3-ERU12]
MTKLRLQRPSGMAIDSIALMVSSGLNAVIGLLYWMAATRLYPVDEVGRASTLISAGMILSSASILAFGQMLERFLPVCGRLRRRVIIGVTLTVLGLSVLMTSGFVVFWPTGALLTEAWQAPAFVASVAALTMFALYDSVLVGLHMGRWAAVKNITHAVVKFGAVTAMGFSAYGASHAGETIIGTWVIPAALLVAAAQVLLMLQAGRNQASHVEPSLPPVKELASYFFTSVGWIIGQVLPGLFVPLLVAHTLGLEQAAYFNIAWIVVSASLMLMSIIGGPYVAQAARPGADLQVATRSMIRIVAFASVFRLIAVAAMGPVALLFYGGDYFANGWSLLVVMGIAHFISGPAFIYGALARVYRQILYPMVVQLLGAVLLVVLAWWWLPSMGIIAVGWAYLVHDILVLLAASVPLRGLLRRSLQ